MSRRTDDMIPLADCVDGATYVLRARNFRVGVYDAVKHSFRGLRTKFDDVFLDLEYHHEAGGTAVPIRKLDLGIDLPGDVFRILPQLLQAEEGYGLLRAVGDRLPGTNLFDLAEQAALDAEILHLRLHLLLVKLTKGNAP